MAAVFPKAIIVGGVTDVVLSMLLGIPLSKYIVSSLGLAAAHASAGLSLVQFTIGFFCSVLGGYIAATIAKRNELLNGVLASWLCLGLGIYSIVSGGVGALRWWYLLEFVTTPLSYLAGAYLWLRRNRPFLFAPDRSRNRPALRVTSSGFVSENASASYAIDWTDIVEICAFKIDLFAVDEVRFSLSLRDGTAIELREEQPGFRALVAALTARFPAVAGWEDKVMQPPFATNMTVLYRGT